jgi:1-carboxybiuret hydrolase
VCRAEDRPADLHDGAELSVRANLGIHTQPISFIGLPVVAVPVPLAPLPIGVQIIAAPWREDVALRIAHALEQAGAVAAGQPVVKEIKKAGTRK